MYVKKNLLHIDGRGAEGISHCISFAHEHPFSHYCGLGSHDMSKHDQVMRPLVTGLDYRPSS